MLRKLGATIGAFALLATGALATTPALAVESDPGIDGPETGWYAVFPDTGKVFVPEESDIWEEPETAGGEVGPMLLDPTSWTQCHVYNNQGWVIVSHTMWWDGLPRNMTLQCGASPTYGWFHIRDGHMDQWKARITQTGVPGVNTDPWDDLMWAAATWSLDYPHTSSGPTSGKLCMTTQVDMYRSDNNQYVYTFYPTFSWSLTNNRLITGYPTTSPGC